MSFTLRRENVAGHLSQWSSVERFRGVSSGGFLFPRTIALPTTLLFITRTPHSEDRLFSSYSKESLWKKAPKNNQDAHDKHARMRNLHMPKGAHTCQKGRDNILPHEKNASSPEDGREENKTRRQTGEKEIKCEQHTHADTQGQNSRIH